MSEYVVLIPLLVLGQKFELHLASLFQHIFSTISNTIQH